MATDDAPTNLPRLVYVDGRGLADDRSTAAADVLEEIARPA